MRLAGLLVPPFAAKALAARSPVDIALFGVGLTTAAASIVFAGVKLGASSETLSLVNTALALLLGFEGSRLVAWSLARRHYSESGVVIGETADEAEDIFFHNWRGAGAVAPPPPPPPPPVGASEEPRV